MFVKNKENFMKLKSIASVLIALLVVWQFLPALPSSAKVSAAVSVTRHTPEDIRKYVEAHPYNLSAKAAYTVEPSVSENIMGKLSGQTLQDAVNALNVVRYIAGLDEVGLDDKYNELTQAAAFVNRANSALSHSPSKPENVSEEIYQLGRTGSGQSNLGSGYSNPANSIIRGYMNDSDRSNIDRVGHRRWCLNPAMGKTGFGSVGTYTAMYAFDKSNSGAAQKNVCWPAQNMPIEYFGKSIAWSISLGEYVDPDNVKVTLTNKLNGKTWTFSNKSSDGYFNVENSNYGQKGCIIFLPDNIDNYSDGDRFTVEINGTGANGAITYSVDFFALNPQTPVSSSATASKPSSSSSSSANKPSSSSSKPASSVTSSTIPVNPVASTTSSTAKKPESSSTSLTTSSTSDKPEESSYSAASSTADKPEGSSSSSTTSPISEPEGSSSSSTSSSAPEAPEETSSPVSSSSESHTSDTSSNASDDPDPLPSESNVVPIIAGVSAAIVIAVTGVIISVKRKKK